MSEMRAVVFTQSGVCVKDMARPDVKPGWARVRVRLAGICGTDLQLLAGYKDFPFDSVVGHEFVGVVAEAPSAPELVGQRVVGDINVTCGADPADGEDVCDACRAGRRTYCQWRYVIGILGLGGAFAEELVLPVANLHRVPDELPGEQAVFAEPLAAACRIPQQIDDVRGARVIVLGAGRLGLLCAQVLSHAGADVSVVTRPSTRLDVLEACGLRVAGGARQECNADVVVEATGSRRGLDSALERVRCGGTIVTKSTFNGRLEAGSAMVQIVVNEITLIGSRCGPLDEALALLSSGAVVVAPLLEATYPMEEAERAFEHAARRGALKVLLAPDPG